jgi:hypothetical protein
MPLSRGTLATQARRIKLKGGFAKEAGLHTLRHTFLTQMGEVTDPFTLQRIAGHSSVKTTMRYVHPQKRAMESAFKRVFGVNPKQQSNSLEVTLNQSQLTQLLSGESVSLTFPPGITRLLLKSTQESSHQTLLPFRELVSQ